MTIIKTPYLTIEPAVWSDPTQVTPNRMELSIQKYSAIITIVNPTTNETIAITNYDNLKLVSMDDNVFIETITETIGNNTFIIGYNLIAIREGSATIKGYYTDSDGAITGIEGKMIYGDAEVVVFDPWFRENYWRLIPETDSEAIGSETYADCLMKACLEMYDILWAYNKDLKDITDPLFAKSKFVNTIGQSKGFTQTDFSTENTLAEYNAMQLYRDLLSNLFDLLKIRGTKLSYEMFFGALGYDIELLEFWYDEEGNLIEINPYDTEDGTNNSTFAKYDINGRQLQSNVNEVIDPRFLVDQTKNPTYCNKSYFIKPFLSAKEGINFGGYTIEQKSIVQDYLKFLKPLHIEYLSEIIVLDMNDYADTKEQYYVLWDEAANNSLEPMISALHLLLPRYDNNTKINDIRPVFFDQKNASTIRYLPYNYITSNKLTNKTFINAAQNAGNEWNNLNNILIDEDPDAYTDITLNDNTESAEITLSNILDLDDDFTYSLSNYNTQVNRVMYTIYLETDLISGDLILTTSSKSDGEYTIKTRNIAGLNSKGSIDFFATNLINKTISWKSLGDLAEFKIKIKNNSGVSANIKIYKVIVSLTYYDIDALGRELPPDPGGLNYTNDIVRGTWHRDKTANDVLNFSQSGGGMCVEYLWKISNNKLDNDAWRDSLLISQLIKFSDRIATHTLYDSALEYKYDTSGIEYDVGYMLLEQEIPKGAENIRAQGIIPINIKVFQNEYNNIIGSKTVKMNTMMSNLKYNGISEKTCEYIMTLSV
jgi:hypothetical protein